MTTDETGLGPAISALIKQAAEDHGIPDDRRHGLREDLIDHFKDGLAAGQSAEQLIENFGDPAEAGRRIAMVCADAKAEAAATSDVIAGFTTSKRGEALATVLWNELWSSFNNLRRAPGFSAIVVLTLALGIGANAAVFSVLDAVVIKPLSYPQAEELVTIQETWRDNPPSFPYTRAPVTVAMRDWKDVFSEVATIYTYRETGADLVTESGSSRLITSYVSAGFFETLGVAPVLGRSFSEEESFGPGEAGDDSERPRVAILSHELWRKQFGTDRSILGRSVDFDGHLTEIVGVMPSEFRNPMGSKADLWIPQDLRLGGRNSWGNYYLNTIARLRPGLSVDQASTVTENLVATVKEQQPESGEWGVVLTQLQSDVVGQTRKTMLLILTRRCGPRAHQRLRQRGQPGLRARY